MEFRLDIEPVDRKSKLQFKTIHFKNFKVNIIERYSGPGFQNLYHLIIKLRTTDDQIINTITGNSRIKVPEAYHADFLRLAKTLASYEYRNKLMNTKMVDDEFVNFILMRMIGHYEL